MSVTLPAYVLDRMLIERTAERDSARAWAVHLEQELAQVTADRDRVLLPADSAASIAYELRALARGHPHCTVGSPDDLRRWADLLCEVNRAIPDRFDPPPAPSLHAEVVAALQAGLGKTWEAHADLILDVVRRRVAMVQTPAAMRGDGWTDAVDLNDVLRLLGGE